MWKPILFTMVGGLALSGALTPSTQNAFAKSDQIYTSWRNNMAIGGFDVVSYYSGTPVKGNEALKTSWNGADWHFSSASNLELFTTSPETYAPQYGGYCAWALSNGKLAKGAPDQWTLVGDKLYLNYNAKIKKRWLKDTDGFIAKSDPRWPTILEK